MHINKNPEDLKMIELCFKQIKAKDDVKNNITKIERALSRMYNIKVGITIVENTTNTFFGMTLFPTEDTMSKLIDNILSKKSNTENLMVLWRENTEWYLEIDSLLLYDQRLNANPAEIAAVLLHEIGHVAFSNSIPQRINKILRYQVSTFSHNIKYLIRNSKIRRILSVVVIEGCSSKNYKYSNVAKEVDADYFVNKMGYGQELDNFINKIIKTYDNRNVNRSEAEMEKDIKGMIDWSLINISELEFRKTKLRNTIHIEELTNPSHFVKNYFQRLKLMFFGDEKDAYKTMVIEQYLMENTNKILQESILELFDNIGKVKKVTQSDVDILEIQGEKIENIDDKIYLLDLIYDKLDLVTAGLQLLDKGKSDKVSQSRQTLTNLKTQLEKMRQRVLSTEIKDKQYGVFIKYPKGYEG